LTEKLYGYRKNWKSYNQKNTFFPKSDKNSKMTHRWKTRVKKKNRSSENLSVFLSMLCASFDRKTLWVSQKLKKLSSKNHVFAKKWPKIDFCISWIHFDHKSTVYRLICFPDRLYINCKPLISYFLLLWKLCWLNLIYIYKKKT